MTDPLDVWKRQELAGSMLPCRELSAEEKARDAYDAQARNAVLASWYGRGESGAHAVQMAGDNGESGAA